MNLSQNVVVALRALAANKLRSVLTMLGIIIGVAAVVALIALGNGATAEITNQIESVGSNLVVIIPGAQEVDGEFIFTPLFLDDYEALESQLHNISAIVPDYSSTMRVTYGNTITRVSVTATLSDWLHVRAFEVAQGRFFTAADNRARARVAVLGAQTAEDLFGRQNPIGRQIKIDDVSFEVIGVLKAKGGGGGFDRGGRGDDDQVVIPLETGYARLFGSSSVINGKRQVDSIFMSAADSDQVDEVILQTERILQRQHGLKLSDELDFRIITQDAILETVSTVTGILTAFLGFVAGISLLVGGIGIMNIMLVSVTERTREIGLRKAVGAKKHTILIQFLIETITLSLIGGSIGIAVGWLIAWGVRSADLIQAEVSFGSILLAFFFSGMVGIFFGIYPASRAASLQPIEALRYE